MDIYNVLFKSVETNHSPFAKAFKTKEEAINYVEETCDKHGFEMKSTMEQMYSGWDAEEEEAFVPTWFDNRVEDKDGNSFYFVTYTQTI